MLDLYELAWAAGLFDGEGSCFVWRDAKYPTTSCAVRLTVAQSYNPEVLYRFQRAVGGIGVVYNYQRIRWEFRAYTFETAQAVVALLWRWLSTPKRLQVLAALAERRVRPRVTHCPKGHEYTADNTRIYNGCRQCVACCRLRNRTFNRGKKGIPPERWRVPA